ncbi:MAG: hypothetical protein ACRDAM_12110, partial [Casimicrobium sp.]
MTISCDQSTLSKTSNSCSGAPYPTVEANTTGTSNKQPGVVVTQPVVEDGDLGRELEKLRFNYGWAEKFFEKNANEECRPESAITAKEIWAFTDSIREMLDHGGLTPEQKQRLMSILKGLDDNLDENINSIGIDRTRFEEARRDVATLYVESLPQPPALASGCEADLAFVQSQIESVKSVYESMVNLGLIPEGALITSDDLNALLDHPELLKRLTPEELTELSQALYDLECDLRAPKCTLQGDGYGISTEKWNRVADLLADFRLTAEQGARLSDDQTAPTGSELKAQFEAAIRNFTSEGGNGGASKAQLQTLLEQTNFDDIASSSDVNRKDLERALIELEHALSDNKLDNQEFTTVKQALYDAQFNVPEDGQGFTFSKPDVALEGKAFGDPIRASISELMHRYEHSLDSPTEVSEVKAVLIQLLNSRELDKLSFAERELLTNALGDLTTAMNAEGGLTGEALARFKIV